MNNLLFDIALFSPIFDFETRLLRGNVDEFDTLNLSAVMPIRGSIVLPRGPGVYLSPSNNHVYVGAADGRNAFIRVFFWSIVVFHIFGE